MMRIVKIVHPAEFAQQFYQMGLKEGYKVFGVIQEENFQAKYIEIRSSLDIVNSRNSKYTYSDMRDCFYAVLKYLKQNEKVIFIGLPCQLAALKCHVNRILSNSKKLFLVELMCHGIASHQYLLDHMRQIEKAYTQTSKDNFFPGSGLWNRKVYNFLQR